MGIYLIMGILKFAAGLVIAKWVPQDQTAHVVLAPIVFLSVTTAGGYIAARIRRGVRFLLALSVLLTVVVLIQRGACTIPVPWWYRFGFLTLGPLTVLIAPRILGSHKSEAHRAATS